MSHESPEYFIIYKKNENGCISIEHFLCCSYDDAVYRVSMMIKEVLDESPRSVGTMEEDVNSDLSIEKSTTDTGVQVGNLENNRLRYFVKAVEPHWM